MSAADGACAGGAAPPATAWGDLPPDLLQCIGALMSEPGHVSSASLVCRSWKASIPAGCTALELDMHPSREAWSSKVEQLGQLTPAVSSLKAHVSSATPKLEFAGKIRQLGGKLRNIQHLDLELSEGFELWLDGSDELRELPNLRSLTLSGGFFTPAAVERLLQCLAVACPLLEELRVLPEPRCGLGDDQVALLAQLRGLRLLEFRAYRLTAGGLLRLAEQLRRLAALSVHGLDACLDAATAACFAASPALRELHLGCDYELGEAAMAGMRGLCGVAGGLSMKFRWTDKLNGLLRTARLHLQAQLVRLDLGCVRLGGDPSALSELAALTALSDLRMSVYSNSDALVTLNLSQLTALSNLQVLHLAKQHAYFPEQRRMRESSIAVPLSAEAAAKLAAGCRKLRALRLCLGASDVTAEGLAELGSLSSLRSLSVRAEPFGSPPQPVALDLLALPRGLTSLELRNVDITTAPADLLAAAATDVGGGAGGQDGAASSAAAGCSSWAQPPAILGQLSCLRLESCRLRTPQLQALALALPSLQKLKLSHVSGLCDAGIESLSRLTTLAELSVLAPHNRALTQASLAALAPLRGLRYLSWQTDDLTSLGPVLRAYCQFTMLRTLSLACTAATFAHACGEDGRGVFREVMPYCDLDLIC